MASCRGMAGHRQQRTAEKICRNKQTGRGWYMVGRQLRKDGDTVKDWKYVQLYDEKSKSVPVAGYNWVSQDNMPVEPGGNTGIILGTSASDLLWIRELIKNLRPCIQFFTLNMKEKLQLSRVENDRGGFDAQHFFVKDNRFSYIRQDRCALGQ